MVDVARQAIVDLGRSGAIGDDAYHLVEERLDLLPAPANRRLLMRRKAAYTLEDRATLRIDTHCAIMHNRFNEELAMWRAIGRL